MSTLSRNQRLFASAFAQASGLDPRAVEAWMIAEEPAGARVGYKGTQDWLNIGITDSGPMGAGNTVWQDPVKAGIFSARWMAGKVSDPGFGTAASGIQAIMRTAGQSPQAQLTAIANSPWASSHYGGAARLISLLGQVGGKLPSTPAAPGSGTNGASSPVAKIGTVKAPVIAGPNLYTTLGGLESARQAVAGDTSGQPDALQQGWDALSALIAPSLQGSSGNILKVNSPSGTGDKPQDSALKGSALSNATHAANALVGASYTWGGGHAGWQSLASLRSGGIDCSGFVSAVLHAAGLKMSGPQTTAGLPSYLAGGQGRYITVWDRADGSQAHVIININGQFYESGGRINNGVVKMTPLQAQQELSGGGFVPYHPNLVKSSTVVHTASRSGGGDSGPITMHANTAQSTVPGNSRVVHVSSDEAGQPKVLLQFTSGDDKGKYYHVTQATDPLAVGQYVPKGTTLAGTLGWDEPGAEASTLLKTNATPQPVAGSVPENQNSTPTTPLPKASPPVNPSLVGVPKVPTVRVPSMPDPLSSQSPIAELKLPKVA